MKADEIRNRICWGDHHMALALTTAQRSCDPNTQVGACIVDARNRIVGLGYNNPPKGISCNQIPWNRKNEDAYETKYPYVIHAERNAINNANNSVEGCSLFVTMYSCESCARDIIQAGIKKIFYLTNPYKESSGVRAAAKMFELVDIEVTEFKWQNQKVASYFQDLSKVITYSK